MSKNNPVVRPEPPAAAGNGLATPQRASSRLHIGDRFVALAEVEVTPLGMLAAGAMVGAILLGSAAVVLAARR
jgi:hypothetical protein